MKPSTDTAPPPVASTGPDAPGRPERAPAPVVKRPRRRLRDAALWITAGVFLLALWQVLVGTLAPSYIATPIDTVKVIPDVLSDPAFDADVRLTLVAVVEGLLIAAVLGTLIGLVLGRLPDVNRVLGMYVGAFYAIPLVAVVPLLTVWFGYTPRARLIVIVVEAILPIIYNVGEGARHVPSTIMDVTRVHRVPWYRVWFGVALPNALPYVLAGVDLAIGRAIIGAVVAEFITSVPGLGYFILFDVRSFHQNEAMVALGVLVLAALIIRALVNLAVSRGLRWYRPAEGS